MTLLAQYMTSFTESVVEEAALACLESPGLQVTHGPGVTLDIPAAERTDCSEVIVYKAPDGEVRAKYTERFLKDRDI